MMFFVSSRQTTWSRACRLSPALIGVIASIAIILCHKRDSRRRAWAVHCWRHHAWEGAAMDEPPRAVTDDSGPEADFGSKLRAAREKYGISMRELGRRTYRSHSSLVEYERGYRLAPEEVVRDYESALEIDPGSLLAEREKAVAERARIGRDGTLPCDAAPPSVSPPDQPDAGSPAPRTASDRNRRPSWQIGVAAGAGVVAMAATVAALIVGGLFDADDRTGGASRSAPPVLAKKQVSIAVPPEHEVPKCWKFRGSAQLKAGHTLVLGVQGLDNGDPDTYFEAVNDWRGGTVGRGSWSRPMFFGGAAGQAYAVHVMALPVAAVAKMPNKTADTAWHARARPREATLLQTMHVHRILGAGSC
jgi:transcriptional regulator with XRE-family HTH domain